MSACIPHRKVSGELLTKLHNFLDSRCIYFFITRWYLQQVEEIYNFAQDDLLTEDIYLLDTHAEVFVWVGQCVDPKEKQTVFEIGQVTLTPPYQLCFSLSLLFSTVCSMLYFMCRNTLNVLDPWKACLLKFHYTKSPKGTNHASSPLTFLGTPLKLL